jgi:hypothetical protein
MLPRAHCVGELYLARRDGVLGVGTDQQVRRRCVRSLLPAMFNCSRARASRA